MTSLRKVSKVARVLVLITGFLVAFKLRADQQHVNPWWVGALILFVYLFLFIIFWALERKRT